MGATRPVGLSLEALREDFGGEVVQPDDEAYDDARHNIYNAMIDRRPALIARPSGTSDVMAAVRFAREHDLAISVRCGGHSAAGHAVGDGALMLDLSLMKGVHVDRERRVARARGGVQWGEYDRETQAFGLHTPGGRATTTGIGGFTLGGGYGWTSPKFGLTCDNLVSADVVTADGELVTASEKENEELFWALRGGGGNFGVVTSFEYRLHPLGVMLAGILAYPLDRGEDAMAAWADIVDAAPDELSTAAAMLTAPQAEFVPEPARGHPVLGFLITYAGDPDEGARLVEPLRKVGPAVDLVQPMPYRVLQRELVDPLSPYGLRNYWRGFHLKGLDENVVEEFLRHPTEGLHPLSFLIIFQHGGIIGRVPEEETAFSNREATYMLHPIGCWDSPEDDERHIGWVREMTQTFERFETGGVYLNLTADEDRVQSGFDAGKWQRLVDVKRRYDPDNVFRFNQNIAP